jgi:hypothetical protein
VKHDRDGSVERLIETALRVRRAGTPAADTCLDAEAIAAWSEQSLPAQEARAVELHLTRCARCQEMAAVFARSARVPAAAAPWWRRLETRWFAPALAGAAALALVVWATVPGPGEPAPAVETLARSDAAEPAPPAAGAPQLGQRSAGNQAAAPAPELRRQEAKPGDAKAANERRAGRATSAPLAAAPPPPPPAAPAPRPQPASPPVTVTSAAPVIETKPPAMTPPPPAAVMAKNPPVGQAAGVPPAAARREMADAALTESVASSVVAEFATPAAAPGLTARGGAGRGGGGRGGGGAARQLTAEVVAPVRWRVLATGVVEKSTDNGTTWTRTEVDPALRITGGAAPAPQVCWLIGRGGTVLRSTDGVRFTRVTPPADGDLAAIQATNALEAIVTTASGRVRTTTDGGRTWK